MPYYTEIVFSSYHLVFVCCFLSDTACGSNHTNKNGSFASPNSPRNYPAVSHCVYHINVTNATQIEFFTEVFSTQRDNDRLYYGNGTRVETDTSLGYFSGTDEVPSSFTVRGGWVWFLFISDLSINARGFNISWEASLGTVLCLKLYIYFPLSTFILKDIKQIMQ